MCVRDIDFTTEFLNFSNGVVFFCYIIIFCYHYKCIKQRPSWSCSSGSWIYNYICNQCRSPLTLLVRIPFRQGVLDTTLCDKVCQWHEACLWFFPGTPVSSTNKTDRHDITEILLKVAINPITLTLYIKHTIFVVLL